MLSSVNSKGGYVASVPTSILSLYVVSCWLLSFTVSSDAASCLLQPASGTEPTEKKIVKTIKSTDIFFIFLSPYIRYYFPEIPCGFIQPLKGI
jgi:hypothetical protein